MRMTYSMPCNSNCIHWEDCQEKNLFEFMQTNFDNKVTPDDIRLIPSRERYRRKHNTKVKG